MSVPPPVAVRGGPSVESSAVPVPSRGGPRVLVSPPVPPIPGPPNLPLDPRIANLRGVQGPPPELPLPPIVNRDAQRLADPRGRERVGAGHGSRPPSPFPGRGPARQLLPPRVPPPAPDRLPPLPQGNEEKGATEEGKGPPPIPPGRPVPQFGRVLPPLHRGNRRPPPAPPVIRRVPES